MSSEWVFKLTIMIVTFIVGCWHVIHGDMLSVTGHSLQCVTNGLLSRPVRGTQGDAAETYTTRLLQIKCHYLRHNRSTLTS